MTAVRRYDPMPCYPCVGDEPALGWPELCRSLPPHVGLLAVDGPQLLGWSEVMGIVVQELRGCGRKVHTIDLRDHIAPWDAVLARTAPVDLLADDPDFATIPKTALADLFDALPVPSVAPGELAVVFGPGAALVPHDSLWYVDLPKRFAEAAITEGLGRNLGQPADQEGPTTRRLFYVDWPLLDRHRESIAADIDRWIDVQHACAPRWLTGTTLRESLRALSHQPFRTRPTFNTTSWGGHWGQHELGLNRDAPNTALGYELIAPESGILLGTEQTRSVEVPFQLLVELYPSAVLGPDVHAKFGTSFPIRFDYLDTLGGGSLSVHCHPQDQYMRTVFGWPYAQHETYYVMVGDEQNVVYLGLREEADVEEFERRAHAANVAELEFNITEFVQTFPADPHQLFLIPAGTPHGSGAGNVVLEVSATPYLYSLRFYDWLRRDAAGKQRPVHVDHAFRNLNQGRSGVDVRRDLVQRPQRGEQGDGWFVELIGRLNEMFFDVERISFEKAATAAQATSGRFHVLNVVEGGTVTIRTDEGPDNDVVEHVLAYAETLVIPASVGRYEVVAAAGSRLVRAVVR